MSPYTQEPRSQEDPLDQLLSAAFMADQAVVAAGRGGSAEARVEALMLRIGRQQRQRAVALTIAGTLGTIALALAVPQVAAGLTPLLSDLPTIALPEGLGVWRDGIAALDSKLLVGLPVAIGLGFWLQTLAEPA